ncbi:flagellar filament capping protein FliD [Desulfoluna butyratoxydans]|uniref:Flagellar hook-associated protein 2 n=1 Tax=Desulfoluna butyratoxydans TaxID=231438 RepID=A0A4U8YMI1_9BACT|nr:flagellar filament capping protein FliD [Desulfoluna butyratoxydans]VFQ44727.1 flagellar hook-associated protein 2 n-terminus [Desulfoluna butyratoxydans]
MGVSVGGIVSGIDLDGIVEQITEVEKRPVKALEAKKEDFKVLISAYANLSKELSGLSNAARSLRYPSAYTARTATSPDPESYTVSAGSFARTGTYSLEVHQLATSQKLAAGPFTEDALPGGGTLSIQVGDGNPMEITAGANFSLHDLANAINAEKGAVTAGVIFDGTHHFLTLSANDTGAANTISVDVIEDEDGDTGDDAGLSALVAYGNEEGEGAGDKAFSVTQEAKDAIISVDGVQGIHRPSNTIEDVVKDVTLTLSGTAPATTFNVALDQGAISEKLETFVEKYNNVLTFFFNSQKYNGEGEEQGTLFGDQTANRINGALTRSTAGTVSGNDSFRYLSDVGVTMRRVTDKEDPEYGKPYLELNQETLSRALEEHPDDLKRFFTSIDEGEEGFAVRMCTLIEGFNDPTGGILASGSKGLKTKIGSIDKQITRIGDKAERSEERLRNKFNSLESLLAEYKVTSDHLASQLKALPGVSKE